MRTRSAACLALCLTLPLALGCDSGSGASKSIDGVPPERLVAFTAVYANTRPDGAPIQRIVVADFENPSVYEVLSRPDHASVQPRLSPDRQQVIFGDETIGWAHAPRLVHYDRRSDRADSLHDASPGARPFPLALDTEFAVWEADGSGFFISSPPVTAAPGRQDVLHYDLAGRRLTRTRVAGGRATWALGLKSPDTLVVMSNDPSAPGVTPADGPDLYLMSRSGEYLRRIENPMLVQRPRTSGAGRGVMFASYLASEGLIAFTLVEPLPGPVGDGGGIPHDFTTKIAVTNLDGSFFRIYTVGDHYDSWPRMGPAGKILFDRVSYGERGSYLHHKVMTIDLRSGDVEEFVRPSVYGAVSLRLPDAGPR